MHVMRGPRLRSAVIAIALIVCGCTPNTGGPRAGDAVLRAGLSFDYHGLASAGFIDQAVTIRNTGLVAVVPTLAFVAVDASGQPLEGVSVSTAYGSDRGLVVVPPGGAIDVLAFHGTTAARVANVTVRIVGVASVDFPAVESLVQVQAFDTDGRPVTSYDRFASVTDPNPVRVTVRVVALTYDRPPAGVAQQVTSVLDVAGPVAVPASGSAKVTLPAAIAAKTGGAGSIKAYFTPA